MNYKYKIWGYFHGSICQNQIHFFKICEQYKEVDTLSFRCDYSGNFTFKIHSDEATLKRFLRDLSTVAKFQILKIKKVRR